MSFSRRNFLKTGSLAVAVTLGSGWMTKFPEARAEASDLPLVKESDAMAKSLKYCANADHPPAASAERKKTVRKDQYCHSCQLYTKLKGTGKDEIGKCLLMPKNAVSGQGWCLSWVQKPKA